MESSKKKILVAIIYGGISLENHVSIKSATNIIKNIDRNLFDIILIGISKYGTFHLDKMIYNINIEKYLYNIINRKNNILNISFNSKIHLKSKSNFNIFPDIFFPVTHGDFGEDGNIQSILNLFKIPYIGSDLKSSCLCMNKDLTKNLLENNNLSFVPYLKYYKKDILKLNFNIIKKKIGYPFFIKPSNQGSSIGISLVKYEKDFYKAISRAFYFSNIIIIEPLIYGKEIECAILDNSEIIKASVCGEIISKNNFYSYNQKYKYNTKIVIPANIDDYISNKIKNLSIKIFNIFECKNIARIDFLVSKNKIFINEINTIPGFTDNSIYTKLWDYEGINFKKLLSILINSVINIDNII